MINWTRELTIKMANIDWLYISMLI